MMFEGVRLSVADAMIRSFGKKRENAVSLDIIQVIGGNYAVIRSYLTMIKVPFLKTVLLTRIAQRVL